MLEPKSFKSRKNNLVLFWIFYTFNSHKTVQNFYNQKLIIVIKKL